MQTNMSTLDSPLTYARLSDECKKLTEIAGRMKGYALDASPFDALDPAFLKLKAEYREQWNSVHTLCTF
jgi:hypothetical protein